MPPTTSRIHPRAPILNKDGKQNYVILDAHGEGHYVGCNLIGG